MRCIVIVSLMLAGFSCVAERRTEYSQSTAREGATVPKDSGDREVEPSIDAAPQDAQPTDQPPPTETLEEALAPCGAFKGSGRVYAKTFFYRPCNERITVINWWYTCRCALCTKITGIQSYITEI